MSLTTISSSPIIRVFSKHCVREMTPNNLDSNTSFVKASFASSESDGEYETSSEGQLHPGPEAHPSLFTNPKSGPTKIDVDTTSKAEVSTELKLDVATDIEKNAIVRNFVGTLQDLISPQTELRKVSLHQIQKTDKLVPSLESWNPRTTQCYLSDSCQTLQSMNTQSNLALSTAKNSTIDLESVYMEKKFQSTYSHSIGTDSTNTEQNRFKLFENCQKIADTAPVVIGTNPELPPSIPANHENVNSKYNLKKNMISRSHIMSQIDKELAPLQDKINKIFNQVRIDLKGMPLDISINYDNLLGISQSAYFLPNVNSTLRNDLVSCHAQVSTSAIENPRSTKYKLDPSNAYRIKKNYLPNTFSPQEKFPFIGMSNPLTCMNHIGSYSCSHKKHSPSCFENCHSFERLTHENNLRGSFPLNSSYSLREHPVSNVSDNSCHISLNDFPVLQQHLHSFHANVLPVNSENLHRHCRSKVSPVLETSDSKAHTEIKSVLDWNDDERVDKPTMIGCSRHFHCVDIKQSRDNDSRLKIPFNHVKRCQKHKSNESSNSNRPKPFSSHRHCKCKLHRCDLRHQVKPNLKSISPNTSKSSIKMESSSLSNNDDTRNENPSCTEELACVTKPIEESQNQQEQNTELMEVSDSFSTNTIESKNRLTDFEHSPIDEKVELKFQNFPHVVEGNVLEETPFLEKDSDHVQKKSSILSYCSHISRSYKECKEPIHVTEHNGRHDKACNTESIDDPAQQKINLLYVTKPVLNKSTEITENSNTEISNCNQPLNVDISKKKITITSNSISNQHSKMNLPKAHERITIVPIIISSVAASLSQNFDSEKTVNDREKLNAEDKGRLSSDSDSSLSTLTDSYRMDITHLAKKCAFISDSKGKMNSRMTLNAASSSYSFTKPLESQIRIENRTKANDESTWKVSSRNSLSYKTFESPAKNSVTVRRIRGIRTSPEHFMYE